MALNLDTNPTPTGYGQQQPQQPVISSGPNPVTSPLSGAANMVQALMGGYNKYLDRQAQPGAAAPAPMPGADATPGYPMQIHPDAGVGASLGNGGTDANGNMIQALFNPNQLSGLF